jgi:hypothetical protein
LAAVVVLALVFLAGFDLGRLPERQLSARLVLWSIDRYQAVASPRLARLGARCRFEPTCSHYGEAAVRELGTARGLVAASWRILRCAPWTPAGTYDPPPGARMALSQGRS